MQWLTPEQIADEALNAYPGISVLRSGFIPIGSCMLGSDPYFVKLGGVDPTNPPPVRIPHDYASEDESYPEEYIEVVSMSLEAFFVHATIEP